nr:hypothetical protein [Tanacetum cinerariifolium]
MGPLTDITNVSGSSQTTQPTRRRGRPCLCDRVVRLNNTEVTQPLQLSLQQVLPQSPLNSRSNGNRSLIPSTTIPSRITSSPLELSFVANTHVTTPPVRRPGRPPLQPNVVPPRHNVRPCLTRNDDHINLSAHLTLCVMLSLVTVVDTDGNPVHHTQLPTESRIREYCDSRDATYTCSHCQAKYWYGERTVRAHLNLIRNSPRAVVRERFNESSMQPVTLRLLGTRQRNAREYNLPTTSEVVALVPTDGNPTECRDDAIAICRWAGPPDLFVTMTCNPKWPEIERDVENFIPGQPAANRPDTITCVFKMKLDDLIEDIQKGHHFGRVKFVIYTIEFQKRGLPHFHALIFLHKDDKISSTDEIDHVISAELPSEVDDPIGFEAVRTHMMHGPCGDQFRSSPCMSRDGCTKGYPKEYCKETFITRDGWPRYKRSNNIRRAKVSQRDTMLDNRFVVPHNIDLIVKYDCHINVELCNQGSLVKYLFNYLNKGLDRATAVIEGQTNHNNDNNNSRTPYRSILHHADEIEQYLNCRYISACEACWKLLGKTYLWKTIIAWIRSMGKIVLSVASYGIASLLLPNGRTAHLRFCIPLELDNESCCGIDVVPYLACLIREAAFIIWDKEPLQHRYVFEAVDRTFRYVYKHDNPNAENEVFGGKVVVLSGDFRQILPVISNASRAVVVASAINKSLAIWDNCRVFVLTTNMRLSDPSLDVAHRDEMMRFNNWLLSMRYGTLHSIAINNEDEATWIEIPDDLLLPTCDNPIKAIVSSEMHVLHSADIICSITENLEEMQTMYPTEFLNTLKFSCVPNHNLELKEILLQYRNNTYYLNGRDKDLWPIVIFGPSVKWRTNNLTISQLTAFFLLISLYWMNVPLDRKFFVEFCFTTTTDPSRIQPELFDRYVFAFVPFGSLTDRYGNNIYRTDVIGVLRELGPLQDRVRKNQGCNPQLRKIIIADLRQLDRFYETYQYCGRLDVLQSGTIWRPIHPVIFTSSYLNTEELKVTPILEIYKRLTNGVIVGTRYIVYGMVTAAKGTCQRYNIIREAAFSRIKTSFQSLNPEIAYPGRFPNEVENCRIELKLGTSLKTERERN